MGRVGGVIASIPNSLEPKSNLEFGKEVKHWNNPIQFWPSGLR
uniref:Uncharacterized protein n=1 Tax=Rhizophora mucronata TaxID=61149 RepID=A0A2P2IYV4_RHIMU